MLYVLLVFLILNLIVGVILLVKLSKLIEFQIWIASNSPCSSCGARWIEAIMPGGGLPMLSRDHEPGCPMKSEMHEES